jgi:N-acyl-D-aspartate/D-glutamate deacylase
MRFKAVLVKAYFLSLILCFSGLACSSTPPRHYDVIIRNTQIIDGTGRPAFKGDVAIAGEKIVAVGKVKGDAATVIDGTGLVACPGFVDSHSHADRNILRYPLAENYIMQGVTMVLAGNCGGSAAPTKDLSFGDWMTNVEKTPISINLTMLVGLTSTIRDLVIGEDFKRGATKEEVEREKTYLEEAMQSGAFGLSTGLSPGLREYTSDEELIESAKVAQKYGGIWSAHTRWQEQDWFKEDPKEFGYGLDYAPPGEVFTGRYHGLLEAVDLSRRANNIPQMIAHFNTGYLLPQPHPEYLDEAAARATLDQVVEPALRAGQKVYYNIIAADSSGTGRQTSVIDAFQLGIPADPNRRTGGLKIHATPDWLKKMKKVEFVEKLKTQDFREKVKRVILYSGRFKFKYVHPLPDPYWMDCFQILTHKNPTYVGKTIGDIARQRSPDSIKKAVFDESINALFDIIVEDPDSTWVDIMDKREDTGSHRVFLKHPSGMPCSDTSCAPAKLEEGAPKPGPGVYGLFPHYIDTQVKKYGAMSLEEAIMKATYVPAQKVLGLKDRGVLSPDAYADVVVFNFDKLRWAGDFITPNVPPEGIEWVLVNGKVVYRDKAHTGEKPGKLIRHSG